MTHSLRQPETDPPESILLVVADYGPNGGGWGPVAMPTPVGPGVAVYTGSDPNVLDALHMLAAQVARQGREARVVRFTVREDIAVYER